MSVKVVIDSASDISAEEAKKMGVVMLPMQITFKDGEFLDGVDINPKQFYEKLESSEVLPRTSQVNEFRFKEVFENIIQNGDDVIAITISSKLSGTYSSAQLASKSFADKVFVIDSLSASAGERLLCELALQLIKEGKNAKEIAEVLNREKKNLFVFAMVNTLKYLKKGGRISSAVALAGTMLSIKPIVAVVEGEIKMIGKSMGVRKGYALINSIIEQKGGINYSMPKTFIWSGIDNSVLEKYIEGNKLFTSPINQNVIGSTIGTHVGPGAIGLAFFLNK